MGGSDYNTAPVSGKYNQSISKPNPKPEEFKSLNSGEKALKVQGNLMDDDSNDYSEEDFESEPDELAGQFKHDSSSRRQQNTPHFDNTHHITPVQHKQEHKPSANVVKNVDTFNTIENNNELEVVPDHEFDTSEYEGDEDEDDEEESVNELLNILSKINDDHKLKMSTQLVKFIKSNHKSENLKITDVFRKEDILNFDGKTIELLHEYTNDKGRCDFYLFLY